VTKRPTPVGLPVGVRTGSGLTSFSVSDVMVNGIVTAGTTKMAILQGRDKQSYVAKIGARIMDATIKSIDAQGVVFVELLEPGSAIRPQEYRKTLRPAAEVNR
jgi:Tfp pilus assembly protein PilP